MAVINTNVKALFSQAALKATERNQQVSMQQLSTGKRINSSRDDAAGMAIATRMTHQIRSLNMAVRNAGDAISLIQTAEGATNEITDMLQRMRELSVLSVNDTYSSAQKTAMSTEFVALASQITQIASNTQFNGMKVLDGNGGAPGGTATSVYTFQVGANNAQTMTVTIVSQALDQYSLTGATLATAASAASNLTSIDLAIGTLNTQRSTIGAAVNRLTHAVDNLSNVAQNATESRSKIADTAYAQATSDLARQQIIQQATKDCRRYI